MLLAIVPRVAAKQDSNLGPHPQKPVVSASAGSVFQIDPEIAPLCFVVGTTPRVHRSTVYRRRNASRTAEEPKMALSLAI